MPAMPYAVSMWVNEAFQVYLPQTIPVTMPMIYRNETRFPMRAIRSHFLVFLTFPKTAVHLRYQIWCLHIYIYIYNMEYHSFILIAHIHSMTYIEREGEGCQEAGSTFCDFSKSWSRVTVHVRATKAPWDVPYRYTNLVEYMDMPPTWPSLFFVVSSGSHAHEHRSPISVLHNLSHEIAWGS